MKHNPSDTLTTFEAKILHQRYGLGSIDKCDHLRKLRLSHDGVIQPLKSVDDVASVLNKDAETITQYEKSALRKLKSYK